MAKKTRIGTGARVELIIPSPAFEGLDPDPLPVGSEGRVAETYPDGTIEIQWDIGTVATHLETDVELVPAASRRRSKRS